jgi:hypothetical protein
MIFLILMLKYGPPQLNSKPSLQVYVFMPFYHILDDSALSKITF